MPAGEGRGREGCGQRLARDLGELVRLQWGLPLSLFPLKHIPFLVLGARSGRAQLYPAPLHSLSPHTCRGREPSLSASPTPAGLQSALPVKAGPALSFRVPCKAQP